jgi:uncharacterized protein (TIGR00296 family)
MMTAPLSAADRGALLELARAAVRARLGLGPAPTLPTDGPLSVPRGAFVELRVGGAVRAQLGRLTPEGPLAGTVARLAVRAVDGDPRHAPIGAVDLPGLAVRLAALGPLRRVDGPDALRVGLDGVAVQQGWHRGVLLPSAAAGPGWDAATFLKHACLGAGLPARAFHDPDLTIEAFEAEEFGE